MLVAYPYLEFASLRRFVVFLVTFIVIFGIGISALSSICCFRRPTFCAYGLSSTLFVGVSFCADVSQSLGGNLNPGTTGMRWCCSCLFSW